MDCTIVNELHTYSSLTIELEGIDAHEHVTLLIFVKMRARDCHFFIIFVHAFSWSQITRDVIQVNVTFYVYTYLEIRILSKLHLFHF